MNIWSLRLLKLNWAICDSAFSFVMDFSFVIICVNSYSNMVPIVSFALLQVWIRTLSNRKYVLFLLFFENLMQNKNEKLTRTTIITHPLMGFWNVKLYVTLFIICYRRSHGSVHFILPQLVYRKYFLFCDNTVLLILYLVIKNTIFLFL